MGSDSVCGCGAEAMGGSPDPDVGTDVYCVVKERSVWKLNIMGSYETLNLATW